MKKQTKSVDPLSGDISGLIGNLKFRRARFEFAPKNTTVTLRVPQALVDAAKKVAKEKGIKYQKLMRQAIVDAVLTAG